MLGICESCGYRGSQVIYEPTIRYELCFCCYNEQVLEQALRDNWAKLMSQHSPKAA